MPISIVDGEAIIMPLVASFVGRFLGSTSDEGVFPPTGVQYSQFAFAPAVGSEGILVFGDYSLPNTFQMYSYFWEGGKLKVREDILERGVELFLTGTGEGNFGLMVRTKTRTYVTNIPKDSDAAYLLVDPVVLMKYVDGKIAIEQLHRNTRTVKGRKKRVEILKNALHEIELLKASLSLSESRRWEQKFKLEKKIRHYESLLKDLVLKLRESLVFSFFFPEDLAVRLHELDIAKK